MAAADSATRTDTDDVVATVPASPAPARRRRATGGTAAPKAAATGKSVKGKATGEDGPDGVEAVELDGELDGAPEVGDLEDVDLDLTADPELTAAITDGGAHDTAETADDDDADDEDDEDEEPANTGANRRNPSQRERSTPQKSGDFVWDEEESEALRQARKDAELTASADSVRAYLKQIGKVALLNAEEEVELAKRIEAGLYAAERIRRAQDAGEKVSPQLRRDLAGSSGTASVRRTTCWRPTSAWSCRWPSATPAVAWRSWTSSRRATSA